MWMVTLDFICMGSAEPWGMGSKQKIQNEDVSWESNQGPLTFQAGALDHWAMLTVEELWFKLLQYLVIWLKTTHVAIYLYLYQNDYG